MIPPSPMLAKINSVRGALLLAAFALICGCTPAGPRALLKGKRLLDHGDVAAAVIQFERASALLPADARVWNYLGVACQRAGRADEAANAYTTALRLDHDLAEAHYNLGVLSLEQNRPDAARTELTAYTQRRPNDANGWLKLGLALLRGGDLAYAERSFATVLAYKTNEAEAYNGLGLARMQAGKYRDAAQFFAAAFQAKPDYAAALQNLATVDLEYLHDDKAARVAFHAYLNLTPRPANFEEVRSLLASLTPVEAQPGPAVIPAPVKTSPPPESKPKTAAPGPHTVPGESAPSGHPATHPATNPPSHSRPEPANVTTPKINHSSHFSTGFENPIHPTMAPLAATNNLLAANPPASTTPESGGNAAPLLTTSTPATPSEDANSGEPRPPPVSLPRFAYLSPAKPPPGDRQGAQVDFAKARDAEHDEDSAAAEQWYQKAADADPAWFEAQFNAGVVAHQLHHYSIALRRYELALVLLPESTDDRSLETRYNFASALQSAGYPVDAAEQFKKILAVKPNEVRVHLALGNLYAHPLHDPVQARQHYLRALALQPDNPRATDVRFWLAAHPESVTTP